MLSNALLLQLGYNATLVTIGATLLGVAAGVGGTFLYLRKRALVSDAVAHATLPGIGIAFMIMVALGMDGRNLAGLLIGAAASAGVGLLVLQWLTTRTRLGEDAAIGAILSVFFGFGVVLLTIIQSMRSGQQAGLEGFLLGSTAGMLRADAILLATSAAIVCALVVLLRRPLTVLAFDPGFTQATGGHVGRLDLAAMGVVLAVTVVGMKIVGLILVVALLIVPPVTARFWSDRVDMVLLMAGVAGGLSGYLGAAISATAPALPTGPIIVLIGFALFLLSLFFAPNRGVLASLLRHMTYQRAVHVRQGLLALAQGVPIYEAYTARLLRSQGWLRPDGVATEAGVAQAARALRDEARWRAVREDQDYVLAASRYDGLTDIETILTADQLAEIDARISGPKEVTA